MIAPRLLAITPGDHLPEPGRDRRPWLEALGRVGLPAVLIREPHLGRAALEALVAAAEAVIPHVVVHLGNPHAASLGRPVHAPTRHLAPDGPPIAGASCHDGRELDLAFGRGAAYALLSPVWAPTSKPGDTRAALGPERFLALAAGRPVLALGGVTPERLAALVGAGGYGGAVLGGIFGAPTPDAAAERCARLLEAAYSSTSSDTGSTMKKRSS